MQFAYQWKLTRSSSLQLSLQLYCSICFLSALVVGSTILPFKHTNETVDIKNTMIREKKVVAGTLVQTDLIHFCLKTINQVLSR